MKYCYTAPLPEVATSNESTTLGQQLAKQGLVDGGDAVVTPISSNAADLTLEGQYRWGKRVSTMLAAELDELSDSALSELPLFQRDGEYDGQGYYVIESADVNPLHANRRDAWQYTLSLTKEGSRASYRRAVETSISQVDHPFGNNQTAYIGVPSTASGIKWFDPETRTTTDASLVATRSAELGDVEIYDANAASYDDPTLVYELPYDDEGPIDVHIWDTKGNASKLNSDGIRQWQKCFSSAHDYEGETVIENGLVRLRFDESTPALAVERWDDAAGSWSSQALGTSDWELFDINVRKIGIASAHARVEFHNPVASPTDYCTLDCWLARGDVDPLWAEVAEPVPTGLVDLLDPVASGQSYEAGASKSLVDRGEL